MASLEIVDLTPELAGRVSDLVYRCYGYSCLRDWAYKPDALMAIARRGYNRVIVGVAPDGRVQACFVALHEHPSAELVELGPMWTAPDIGAEESGLFFHQLAKLLGEYFARMGAEVGLRGVLARAVTVHNLTARMEALFGFVPCGIYLDYVPAWADRDRPAQLRKYASAHRGPPRAEIYQRRRAHLVTFYPFHWALPPREISLPRPYRDLVLRLYARMKLEVVERAPRAAAGETSFVEATDFLAGRTTIEVRNVGADAVRAVRARCAHYRDGMMPVIHVLLPLTGGDVQPIVDALLDDGFGYGALLPLYRDGDVLILQDVSSAEGILSEDQLLQPEAREIHRVIHDAPWFRAARVASAG